METQHKYSIVFKKLDELVREEEVSLKEDQNQERATYIPQKEFDEIDELRRLSEELLEPRPRFFTQT